MRHSRACSLAILLALSFLSVAILTARSTRVASAFAQSSDETALRALVERFYDAYAKQDLKSLTKMWSERSPGLAARIEAFGQLFALESSAFSSPAYARIKIEGDRASLLVALDLNANNAQTREPRKERLTRRLSFVKEGDEWKLFGDDPAGPELVAELLAAPSEEQRKRLLTDRKKFLTPELQQALVGKAVDFLAHQDYSQSIQAYALAQAVAEAIGSDDAVAVSLLGLGNASRMKGDYGPALDYSEKALARFEDLNAESGIASALDQIGLIHHLKRDYREALATYQKLLARYEALGSLRSIADALDSIASVHYDQESFDLALQFFERSLARRQAAGDKEGAAATNNNIGTVHYNLGKYDLALEHYRKSLAYFEAADDRRQVAATLRNLGSAHFSQGDYDLALELYAKSLAIDEALGYKEGTAGALADIGLAYSSRGNYGLALDHFLKSLRLREELGDREAIAATLSNIAAAHNLQGDYAAALEHYQKSLSLEESLANSPRIAAINTQIGSVHYALGDYAAALEHYRKALAQYQALGEGRGIAGTLAAIGDVHYSERSYGQALEDYHKSLARYEASDDSAGTAATLGKIGSVHYSEGSYDEALKFAERAAAIAGKRDLQETLWRARFTAGAASRAMGEPARARQSFEDAIFVIEAMREQTAGVEREQRFFQDKASPYLAMVELLIGQNNASDAFRIAERIKTHQLLDILESGRVKITRTLPPQEIEKERALDNRLAAVNAQIRSERAKRQPDDARLDAFSARRREAISERKEFRARLYATYPRLRGLRGEAEALNLEESGAVLSGAKGALLEYIVTEGKTYLFVLTFQGIDGKTPIASSNDRNARRSSQKRGPALLRPAAPELKVYTLSAGRAELARQVAGFRNSIARRDEAIEPAARQMYDLLLGPARGQIEGGSALVVVPDAALWHLPFQALQSGENRYLIEERALLYAPSLAALGDISRQRRKWTPTRAAPLRLLAFGNPTISNETAGRVRLSSNRESLDPMPEADTEVRALEQLYGVRHSRIYTGEEAREQRLKAEAAHYDILHFAARGTLSDSTPMYSSIFLSEAGSSDPQDGLLEAWEIAALDLNARLAVLSRTGTGGNQTKAGEGAIAMYWALFVAGCPATVASQWAVTGQGPTTLMTEFHRNLKLNKGAARALQQAAESMLKTSQYKHPYYWAGFNLIGDGM